MDRTNKTIIRHGNFLLTAALSLVWLSTSTTDAEARKGKLPGKPRHGGLKGRHLHKPGLGLDMSELGALRDKFSAYQHLTFGGAGYYTKLDHQLREAHTKTYALIRHGLVEDRINEELGRKATKELLAIGEEAKVLRGNADSLNGKDKQAISDKIHTLAQRIKKAYLNNVNPDILTPTINERQATMEELHHYAVNTDAASAGQASTMRRHLTDLEKKEASAKKDNEVSDRERENLTEKTIDVWKSFVKTLKP